jgi:hypothetical protein
MGPGSVQLCRICRQPVLRHPVLRRRSAGPRGLVKGGTLLPRVTAEAQRPSGIRGDPRQRSGVA